MIKRHSYLSHRLIFQQKAAMEELTLLRTFSHVRQFLDLFRFQSPRKVFGLSCRILRLSLSLNLRFSNSQPTYLIRHFGQEKDPLGARLLRYHSHFHSQSMVI